MNHHRAEQLYLFCERLLESLTKDDWEMAETLDKYPMDYFQKSPVSMYLNEGLVSAISMSAKLPDDNPKVVASVSFTYRNVDHKKSCLLLTGGFSLYEVNSDKSLTNLGNTFSHDFSEAHCKLPSLINRYLADRSNHLSNQKKWRESVELSRRYEKADSKLKEIEKVLGK